MLSWSYAKGLVGLIGLSLMAVILFYGYIYFRDSRDPDYQTMRAFRISKLSEAYLTKAYADAQSEFVSDRERKLLLHKEEQAKRLQERKHCDQIGFREKNPLVCWTGIAELGPYNPDDDPGLETVATRYEMKIMGICMFVNTIRQAKDDGCLQ